MSTYIVWDDSYERRRWLPCERKNKEKKKKQWWSVIASENILIKMSKKWKRLNRDGQP